MSKSISDEKPLLFKQQKELLEHISKGGNVEIIRRRPRPFGLTTNQLNEFNKMTATGKRIVWHAPKWVAMDRKTYDSLVSKANTSNRKIWFDEVSDE